MKLDKVMMNPVRLKVIQYLMVHTTATAGELSVELNEVPRTTLYRHLGVLEDNTLIKVVEENKIRGTMEKVYALAKEGVQGEDPIESAKNNAFRYFMGIYGDFVKYFDKGKIDTNNDRLFIKNVRFWMSDEEFDSFFVEMEQIYEKYGALKEEKERKQRNISTISSPTEQE